MALKEVATKVLNKKTRCEIREILKKNIQTKLGKWVKKLFEKMNYPVKTPVKSPVKIEDEDEEEIREKQ